MIPDRFINKDRRLSWDFFFHNPANLNDRKPTDLIRFNQEMIDYGFATKDMNALEYNNLLTVLTNVLPNSVTSTITLTEFATSDVVNQWLRNNVKGVWQIWIVKGAGRFLIFYFQNENDAILFKLRWG